MVTKQRYTQRQVPNNTREAVEKRAGGYCYRCLTKDDRPRKMVIHHLDYDEVNNSLGNLIYLCHSCHRLIHKASLRPTGWNKHFYAQKELKA
jgi:5-methylcytosine-specific restriction endonuclease McrA